MVTFLTAIILLVLGYVVYGSIVERVFGVDANRKTPCYTMQDGVDYQPMATWKVFLIQFLNIAGTGPIFGAIQGILFGPSAYIWIVLGCIFGVTKWAVLIVCVAVMTGQVEYLDKYVDRKSVPGVTYIEEKWKTLRESL